MGKRLRLVKASACSRTGEPLSGQLTSAFMLRLLPSRCSEDSLAQSVKEEGLEYISCHFPVFASTLEVAFDDRQRCPEYAYDLFPEYRPIDRRNVLYPSGVRMYTSISPTELLDSDLSLFTAV